jgi:CheY-like chemotaxis protein
LIHRQGLPISFAASAVAADRRGRRSAGGVDIPAEPPENLGSMANTTKNVMIVEDFAALGRALGEILELEGFVVNAARNGAEALDALNGGARPDAIVLDYKMPKMTGGEFLERVKSDERFKGIPIIAVSAASNAEFCSKADHFLRKPLNTAELVRLIRESCK